MNWPSLTVFVALFLFVTGLGFWAARWRAGDLTQLHEWGLGGRRFGTFVTWFLLGGDLYTAYTFIAVPALVYGAGALGFFAVPYTILIYPLLYLIFPRLWSLAHKHGYVTSSDVVLGRYGNKWLALAVGVTGIVATMPYIALQLVGMQVVIGAMGVSGEGVIGDLPLIIAFVILAAFTYTSGLRAPAMIAVVKDLLIYLVVIAVTVFVPLKLGDSGRSLPRSRREANAGGAGRRHLRSIQHLCDLGAGVGAGAVSLSSLADGYLEQLQPGRDPPERCLAAGLLAGARPAGTVGLHGRSTACRHRARVRRWVQALRQQLRRAGFDPRIFPGWFAGVAFAAIAIGALVPSAIMSIACANIVSRTIYRGFLAPHATNAQESSVAKIASLLVKTGALVFIIFVPVPYALQFQLLGGLWMIQVLPSVILGLYLRMLNGWALLGGWAVGTAVGTWMASTTGFKAAVFTVSLSGTTFPGYIALWALIANMVVSIALSIVLKPFVAPAPVLAE